MAENIFYHYPQGLKLFFPPLLTLLAHAVQKSDDTIRFTNQMSGHTAPPKKIKTAVLLYLITVAFKLILYFYCALDIPSPKRCSIRSKYFSKIGQDGGKNNSADQDRKATALILYFSCPVIKLLSRLLQCLGHIQSNNIHAKSVESISLN